MAITSPERITTAASAVENMETKPPASTIPKRMIRDFCVWVIVVFLIATFRALAKVT